MDEEGWNRGQVSVQGGARADEGGWVDKEEGGGGAWMDEGGWTRGHKGGRGGCAGG